jgi:hypothetical protein
VPSEAEKGKELTLKKILKTNVADTLQQMEEKPKVWDRDIIKENIENIKKVKPI